MDRPPRGLTTSGGNTVQEYAVRGLGVEGFFDFCVGRVHEVGDDRKELKNVKTIPLVCLKVQAVARDAADSGAKNRELFPLAPDHFQPKQYLHHVKRLGEWSYKREVPPPDPRPCAFAIIY